MRHNLIASQDSDVVIRAKRQLETLRQIHAAERSLLMCLESNDISKITKGIEEAKTKGVPASTLEQAKRRRQEMLDKLLKHAVASLVSAMSNGDVDVLESTIDETKVLQQSGVTSKEVQRTLAKGIDTASGHVFPDTISSDC